VLLPLGCCCCRRPPVSAGGAHEELDAQLHSGGGIGRSTIYKKRVDLLSIGLRGYMHVLGGQAALAVGRHRCGLRLWAILPLLTAAHCCPVSCPPALFRPPTTPPQIPHPPACLPCRPTASGASCCWPPTPTPPLTCAASAAATSSCPSGSSSVPPSSARGASRWVGGGSSGAWDCAVNAATRLFGGRHVCMHYLSLPP